MRSPKQTLVLVLISALIFGVWIAIQPLVNKPKPDKPKEPEQQAKKEEPDAKPAKPKEEPPKQAAAVADLELPAPARRQQFVTLGDDDWNLIVTFDPRGAGIRRLVAPRFEKADINGRPVRGEKLEIIPEAENDIVPSYLMYRYAPDDAERPLDMLGKVEWEIKKKGPEEIVFSYTLPDVVVTKTYTLHPKDYHVGLAIKVECNPARASQEPVSFQYQLASGHGLPIEGQWYSSVQRNAVVCQVSSSGPVERELQELRQLSHKLGGEPVRRQESKKDKERWAIQYAGVLTQYFGSLIVVPPDKEPPPGKEWDAPPSFLIRAQPTVDSLWARGQLVAEQGDRFKIRTDKGDRVFLLPHLRSEYTARADLAECKLGDEVVVINKIGENDQFVATQVLTGDAAHRLFADDISVRVVTQEFTVKPNEPIEQKYLLYNGPVKVRLLAHKDVPQDTVDYYENALHLDKLTDYQTSGFFGTISKSIGWNFLLIKCTNLMHALLALLHSVIPWSYGLSIIMLTVIVRGLMHPLSRKQAKMSLKMQELAPEIKKLQEKFKGDRQALGMAQMELYRKHGVNPLGSCWVLLLQMPIFLGLYYALQESVDFRLATFLWVDNLAAPDMLFSWSTHIPWISRPEDYGGWLYLGPYFNLMPIVAVALMIVQQKFLMPPPTDEQQEMQQKMMKYMMIFMGFMFYKVAAGLCVYFIASSLWGFAERKMLPKKRTGPIPEPGTEKKGGFFQKALERMEVIRKQQADGPVPAASGTTNGVSVSPKEKAKRRKQGRDKPTGGGTPAAPSQDGNQKSRSWLAGLRQWWADVLKKAEKR